MPRISTAQPTVSQSVTNFQHPLRAATPLLLLALLCLALLAGGCASRSVPPGVRQLQELFNGQDFARQVRSSGVVESAQAALEGDTALVLSLKLAPGLDLGHMPPAYTDNLRQRALGVFRNTAAVSQEVRLGLLALDEAHMKLIMRWVSQPVDGQAPRGSKPAVMQVVINPAEFLSAPADTVPRAAHTSPVSRGDTTAAC